MNKKLLLDKCDELGIENAKLKTKIMHLEEVCRRFGSQEKAYRGFMESLSVSDKCVMGEWCKLCKHYRERHIPQVKSIGFLNAWYTFDDEAKIFCYCDKHLPEICKEFECEEVTE